MMDGKEIGRALGEIAAWLAVGIVVLVIVVFAAGVLAGRLL